MGKIMNTCFQNVIHECDFCVVGGGLAGMCAAISAARRGLSVVIMQDRPLFGGNASGEVRMWISGAHGKNNRETGILEELALENLYRNPDRTYPLWDSILFSAIKEEDGITPILNCSCNDCEMSEGKIVSVTGWQTTTQRYHTVRAKYFADCSGDSVLAPLTGAKYRVGRESRTEFGESIAPETSDRKTMGLSCLIQATETDRPHPFVPPSWANHYTKEDLPYRLPDMERADENFWYMELGGTEDTISDTEEIRDKLLAVALGIWDYVKNSGEYDAECWELTFLGFLPGKRESRRYVGDYVMNQNDVASGGRFDDTVAFGGWTMDDHNPFGIETKERPNIFHPAPSPFGIPYRSLYSVNVENLFFAGRNISVTHCAMSATRVMATCALLGQAVGTAAAVANRYSISPRGVYEGRIKELQQLLMEDDCYLPGFRMEMSEIILKAKIISDKGDVSQLINGNDRPIADEENVWTAPMNTPIDIKLEKAEKLNGIRFVFDSDLNRETIGADGYMDQKNTIHNLHARRPLVHLPKTLIKDLKVELFDENGKTVKRIMINDNRKRLVKLPVFQKCSAVRLTPLSSYGANEARIFSVNLF